MTSNQPVCKTYPDGRKEWLLNDLLHRTDGPAIVYADGYKEWRLNHEKVTWQEVYHAATTDEDRVNILYNALT